MNRYLKTFLSSTLFLFAIISSYAQPSIIVDSTSTPANSNVTVDFRVSDIDNMDQIQFSVNWNPNELEFVEIASVNDDFFFNLNQSNFDLTDVSNGNLVISWKQEGPDPIPRDVEERTLVFQATFKTNGVEGDNINVDISNMPSPIIMVRNLGTTATDLGDDTFLFPGTITLLKEIPDAFFNVVPQNTAEDICIGNQICYDIEVINFVDIAAINCFISWDSSVIKFVNANNFNFITNQANFNVPFDSTSQQFSNEAVFFYFDIFGGETLTIEDGTSIVTMCFEVVGDPESSTTIDLEADEPQEILNGAFEELDVFLIPPPEIIVEDCQSKVSFSIACQDIRKDETVCLDFTTSNFENIVQAKYTVTFDPDKLEFVKADGFNLTNFDESNITVNNGVLILDWADASPSTLTNGTSIFSGCFKAIGDIDSESPLGYLNLAGSGYEITNTSGQSLQPQFSNCDQIKILPPTVGLTVPPISTPPNTNICVEIKVENFLNIGHIEMPITWDPLVIEYTGVNTTGLAGLTANNFKVDIPAGKLELEEWDSPVPEGVTLPDGSTIFEICFRVVGNLGTESPITFPQSATNPVFIQNANNVELDVNPIDGIVTVETSGLVLSSTLQEEKKNTSFCVDIQTSNFNEIVSAGYAHLYDPAVLRFDSVQITGAISNLSANNFDALNEGTIRIGWQAADASTGTTIADGNTIYSLCFTAIGDLGACSDFRLDNIQDISTVQSAGADIGTFDNTKDICIDNFGMILVDTLKPSCRGGDGQIRLTVSGDPSESIIYTVRNNGNPIITGADVENDSIILDNLEVGIYSISITSLSTSKTDERTFNLNLSAADFPSIDLGEDINAGCVEADSSISIQLDAGDFSVAGVNRRGWTALGTGIVDSLTANDDITTALAPGRYIFTIEVTTTGCSASDTIDVLTIQNPRVELAQHGSLGCVDSTIQLGVEFDDGFNSNYVFLWEVNRENEGNIVSGDTSLNAIVDQEGWYTFTALDTENGCKGIDSTFVMKNTVPPAATVGTRILTMECKDDFITLIGIPSLGAEVQWSTNNGSSIANSDQEEADVTRVGTYYFTVTNQINGCQATDSTIVMADESLPVARAEDLAIIGCKATDVKLDASESSQGTIFSYRWEDPNNNLISTEDTIRTAIEGEYLFIVTNDGNSDCISDTARVMVTVNTDLPTTFLPQSFTIDCQEECSPLEATVPNGDHFTYRWEAEQDGVICSGEDTPTVMVGTGGFYRFFTLDENNNCESMDVTLVIKNGPNADAGASQQLDCDNEIVTLDGRGSDNISNETTSFAWKAEDGTVVSTELTTEVTLPGTYTLELMDASMGCSDQSTVMVIEDTKKPIADAGEAPFVSGCEFPTGRVLDGAQSDSGDTIAYAWSSATGMIVGDTFVQSPEIASPGIYVLTVTNTNNGCFSIDEVSVISDVVIPVANAGLDKELTCDESEISLAGFSEELAPGSTILWSTFDGGNITGPADQLSVNIDAPGTYVLSITSVDNCETTDTVVVDSSIDAPEADAGEALEITCNNNLTINGRGTMGDSISISWTTVGGNIVSGADTYTPEVNRGGSYTLTVLNTNNNCPTTSLVFIADSEELPEANAGDNQEICTNESMLSAVQPAGNFAGNWTTLEKSMVVSPTDANSMVADLVEGANTYIWTLSNETCGNFSSDTVIVNVPTFPIAEDDVFQIQPDQNMSTINLIENDEVNSDMVTINILEQPTAAQLTDAGNGALEFSTPARYFGTQQFLYEVCSATCSELCDDAIVRVIVLPGADVDTTNTVPNAITPNGDGMNDVLLIDELIFDAVDFPKSELIIFNRWGDVVYKASPYNNDWQGTTSNGDDLPEGTYYYILRLDIVEGDVMKGDITILR